MKHMPFEVSHRQIKAHDLLWSRVALGTKLSFGLSWKRTNMLVDGLFISGKAGATKSTYVQDWTQEIVQLVLLKGTQSALLPRWPGH